MRRILVCEDEQNIREFVVINLKRAGYEVSEACTADEALETYERESKNFDVIILDIMTPGKYDGLAVCRKIRDQNENVGIIMLTAKTQEIDKVSGLMMGADDYMTKPFSPSELVARVDAIYRRVEQLSENRHAGFKEEMKSGEFTLNLRNRTFTKGDKLIELTQVEFQIIEYFFTHAGLPLSRTDILKHVWSASYAGEEKIVDVNVRRIRMKIEDEPSNPTHIITVWGMGYRWEA